MKKWPELPPLYDIKRSYLENAEEGPFFQNTFPERVLPLKEKWFDFLGYKVASLIGVPAGPLLNSRWTTFAAKMGFDIVTYKTIRSNFHPSHPVPNIVYVDLERKLRAEEEGEVLFQAEKPPLNMENLGATNSFGIPSRDPKYVVEDIARAKANLQEGQVMIASFVGTPRDKEDFAYDFVKAARLCIEGGALILEADFSCPNVISCEGSIHKSPETISLISKAIRKEIPHHPLIIKVGLIPEEKLLEEVMIAAAKASVNAICGINTMSMRVVKQDNKPALGENRLRAGICGAPIRDAALDFIRKMHQINKKLKLGLTIMGTGGVTEREHFDLFFEAGADVAMSALGMMYDPYLALRYHNERS